MLETTILIGLYIDESGKPDAKVKNLDEKYFILTGILADNVANSLVGYALHKTLQDNDLYFEELHAKAFFRGKEGWRSIKLKKRKDFLNEFLNNLQDIINSEKAFLTTISVIGIKKSSINLPSNDIMNTNINIVFENLLERAVLRTSRIHRFIGKPIKLKVFADINEKRREMRQALKNTLKSGYYIPNYKEVKKGKVLIEKEISFVDSKLSYSVQLADLIGYIIHKYYKAKDGQPDKYFDFNNLFELIKPLLDKRERDKKIEGWGLKEINIYKKE